jgi:hypothetical protein
MMQINAKLIELNPLLAFSFGFGFVSFRCYINNCTNGIGQGNVFGRYWSKFSLRYEKLFFKIISISFFSVSLKFLRTLHQQDLHASFPG